MQPNNSNLLYNKVTLPEILFFWTMALILFYVGWRINFVGDTWRLPLREFAVLSCTWQSVTTTLGLVRILVGVYFVFIGFISLFLLLDCTACSYSVAAFCTYHSLFARHALLGLIDNYSYWTPGKLPIRTSTTTSLSCKHYLQQIKRHNLSTNPPF